MDDDTAAQFEDRITPREGNRRGRGGGSASGGRRGGGKKREGDLSRALSRLLRHQAENAGIKLDREGFAPLHRVLQWPPLRNHAPTFADIRALIETNDKQRFSMKPNPATNPSLDTASTDAAHWLIRANQGHSIALSSDGLLRPVTLAADNVPPVVVHGTYAAFWPAIEASGGLRRMGRNHVHCSTGLPEDPAGVVSGMRRDAEILVYVDVRKSLEEAAAAGEEEGGEGGGLRWWISENGVVLSEGDKDGLVPARFFKEVVGRSPQVGTLWRDGQKVADLPAGLRAKVPMGKGRAEQRGRGGGGSRGRGGGSGGGSGVEVVS